MRKRIIMAVAAIATALGLTLAVTTPASAETFTLGRVVHIANLWGAGIGVWASSPPGAPNINQLWYPVYGDTTWTEPVALNIGAGYICIMSYYNSSSTFWAEAPANSAVKYSIGDHGLDVRNCYPYDPTK